jgi:branched-chain amino acid transport system substrate-binding protein
VRLFHFIIMLTLLACSGGSVYAETGVTDTAIVFGQTAAIGGPAEKLGKGMQSGLLAAFKEINDAGGIAGRRLELVTLDDGYEPDRAIQNVRRLIHTERVFAVTGGVGTPTSLAIEPILTARKVPYIAPFTGAEFLRRPYKRYVVNIRASYFEEAERIAEILADHKGFKRIAVLYQDDSFGRTVLEGMHLALERRALPLVAESSFKRNTTAVKRAVLEIKAEKPEAVVMIGTYQPLAAFIRLCHELGIAPTFVSVSFVSSEALAANLGPAGQGVKITQVVPYPFAPATEISKSYRAALRKSAPQEEFGYVSFEGYISGRFIAEILKHMGRDVSREGFINTIAARKQIQLDDLTLVFGKDDHQGLDQIYTTIIDKDGHIQPYEFTPKVRK